MSPFMSIENNPSVAQMLEKYPRAPIRYVIQSLNQDGFDEQIEKQKQFPMKGASIGILLYGEAQVVLVKRSGSTTGWALPGRRVGLDEEFDQAFLREVMETCGVEGVKINELMDVKHQTFLSPSDKTVSMTWMTFVATILQGEPQTTPEALKKGWEVGIFELTELPEGMVEEDREKILQYFGL